MSVAGSEAVGADALASYCRLPDGADRVRGHTSKQLITSSWHLTLWTFIAILGLLRAFTVLMRAGQTSAKTEEDAADHTDGLPRTS